MTRRPNILIVSFDDAVSFWHYKTLFGAALETPNLDRACAVSTAFHAAYCQSPLCGPSRASMMSSSSPLRTGVIGNDPDVYEKIPPAQMWQVALRQNGYFNSSGGKVHHGYRPQKPWVYKRLYSDERKNFGFDGEPADELDKVATGGMYHGFATTDPKDDGIYYDARSARSFERFIESYDGDAPFYREVGFFSPHKPFVTPIRFKQMYDLEQFAYPPQWGEETEPGSDKTDRNVKRNFQTHRLDRWRKTVRNYFSAYSHGDYHFGRVWNALKASRHAENTIVVVVSDHGMHLGERNRVGKSTLLEQVAAVPLIIHDPAHAAARVVEAPVGLTDVGPTLLDFAGLEAPAEAMGRSLRAVVAGGPADPDRAIPTFMPGAAAIRRGRYRFIRHESGACELYDVVADWWQQRELGRDHPAFGPMSRALDEVMREWGPESELDRAGS